MADSRLEHSGDLAVTAGRCGAQTYESVLASAGGRELKALHHGSARTAISAVIYASPPYNLHVPPLPAPRLAINLTPAQVSGGFEGDLPNRYDARRYSLFLTPAGEPVSWEKESPSRHLCLYFHNDVINGTDDEAPLFSAAPSLLNASVPQLRPLVDQLVSELTTPAYCHAEAADNLTRLVLIRLAQHLHRSSATAHTLTPKACKRLRDYVEEHLHERIMVADLAQQIGLSANRFAVAFTEQMGQSPYQFVLARRVARAAQWLTQSTLALAQIAHDSGFSSQQHMSNAIRRFLGTTPNQLRRVRPCLTSVPRKYLV